MMLKKDEGFTLIELLAVIVILAVISLIAMPVILGIIEKVRINADKSSVYEIIDAANLYYAESLLNNTKTGIDGKTNVLDKLAFKGKRPDSGTVNINEQGQVKLEVVYNNRRYSKDYNDTDLTITVINESTQDSINVSQTGTWQYKTTPTVGYVIFGVDDDNDGNANFVRTMREFGMKYVLNSETINLDKILSSDDNSNWHYGENAPASIYPNGVTVAQLSKDTVDNGWGEVALHAPSTKPLIESDLLTGSLLDTAYDTYVSGGGTKSKNDFLQAFKDKYKDTDISQGASYVSETRKEYEEAIGSPIYTVGKWGGNPEFSVDDIVIGNMNSLGISASRAGEANFLRKLNFTAATNLMNIKYQSLVHNIYRSSYGLDDSKAAIDYAENNYTVRELYWHTFENANDIGIDNFRALLEYTKAKVDSGKIKVVTRKEFAELGEYVSNPITSISISNKSNITVGGIDSDSNYDIEVTYLDGTKEKASSDAIIDRSSVDVNTIGNYTVTAYYRGFKAECNVAVIPSYSIPENLKNTGYWFIYINNSNGNWYAGNSSSAITKAFDSAGKLVFTSSTGKINGWKSTNNGSTWELVTDNVTNYSAVKTDGSANGYNFNSNAYDTIKFIETSGNFTINYGA